MAKLKVTDRKGKKKRKTRAQRAREQEEEFEDLCDRFGVDDSDPSEDEEEEEEWEDEEPTKPYQSPQKKNSTSNKRGAISTPPSYSSARARSPPAPARSSRYILDALHMVLKPMLRLKKTIWLNQWC